MRPLLLALLAAGLGGCVSSKWKKLAIEQAQVMSDAIPAMEACANHVTKGHPGHKLSQDGSLRI